MTFNAGTSLDMETIDDVPFDGSGQENGSYYFVKKPGLPLNVNPATPQHPHFQQDAPLDVNDSSDIHHYLQNPSPTVKAFLNIKDQLSPEDLVDKLENALADLFNSKEIYGKILQTTPEDVERALRLALKHKEKTVRCRLSRDERIIQIAKIISKF